ncbi:MAG: glycoside hydrolase family 99-like domain-containing protein [Lentisphaerae bacterium]|nr:glycoside hydrolase family 99-like domain-containing protein [Lentisphaerota bacterium]
MAFYLPQYHPIPENDEWWGTGFTEWTVVTRAKPLFFGHQQPNLPGELGFYDLRVPEVREAQAELARDHGVEGFCYWHYWMGNGRLLLQRPFEEVLASGRPDFPFCLGWANHSWYGRFFGAGGRMLVEQSYPGLEDHRRHFEYMLPAFGDRRYITVDGKPLLYLFKPRDIPELPRVLDLWRQLAERAGLKGLHIIAQKLTVPEAHGYGLDGICYGMSSAMGRLRHLAESRILSRLLRKLRKRPHVFPYHIAMRCWQSTGESPDNGYPELWPNWDNTPRLGAKGEVYVGSTPDLFRQHVSEVLNIVCDRPWEHRLVFLKSWNEWAEGNYVEPDAKWGRAYLRALSEAVRSSSTTAHRADGGGGQKEPQ